MNKKGIVPALIIPLAIGIIILIAAIAFVSSTTLRYNIIGIGIIVLTFIYVLPAVLGGEVTKQKLGIVLMLMGVGVVIIFLGNSGILSQEQVSGGTLQLAFPVTASYKCEQTNTVTVLLKDIPETGLWFSRSAIPTKTMNVDNIKVVITQTFWQKVSQIFLGGTRIRYKTCDANGNQCTEKTQSVYLGDNTLNLPFTVLDLRYNSLFVIIESRATLLSSWSGTDGGKISYKNDIYGLRLYSTTQDPAGAAYCEGTCDINCPDLLNKYHASSLGGEGQPLSNPLESLDFGKTAPYLEYWNTVSYNLNEQGGATLYNSVKNEFCFAGATYTAGKITLDNGVTYIYPIQNTKVYTSGRCCPGAVIATSTGKKRCNNNYAWETISDDTKIKCISDFNCIGLGNNICQNKKLTAFTCSGTDSVIGKYCKEVAGQAVQCCSKSDCSGSQICDNTHTCVTVGPENTCNDNSDCNSWEKCQDGICINSNIDTPTQCAEKAAKYPWLGYEWVVVTKEPSLWSKIITFGFAKPTTEGYCKATFLIYYIWGAIGIVLIVGIIYLIKPTKLKKKKK